MLSKLIQNIEYVVIVALTDNYSSIFKGAIVSFAILLISLSQVMPKFYELSFEAKQLQYEVEESLNTNLSEDVCEKALKEKGRCKLALYKIEKLKKANELVRIINLESLIVGVVLMAFSLVGFCLNVLKQKGR